MIPIPMKAQTLFATLFLALLPLSCETSIEREGGEWIAASNMLHTGFSSWDENGKAVGIEVQYVEEAAKLLGKTVRWVERPFPELFDALVDGEIHIAVSTIGITEPRSQRVDFSIPYFETEIVALVAQDSPFKTLSDLNGKRIGADQATTSFGAAQKQWPSSELVGSAMEGKFWPTMVQEGIIDAFVTDASDQSRLEALNKVPLRRIPDPLQAEPFAVAFPKGHPNWKAALDRAIGK